MEIDPVTALKNDIKDLRTGALSLEAASQNIYELFTSAKLELEQVVNSSDESRPRFTAAIRRVARIHSAAHNEALLQALADGITEYPVMDTLTRDAILGIVHELTLFKDPKDMYNMFGSDPEEQGCYFDEPYELHLARLHPGFVVLALWALYELTSNSAHICVNYLLELIVVDTSYGDLRAMLFDLLRDRECAKAMCACLRSDDFGCLSTVCCVLKPLLGGQPNAIFGGLAFGDSDEEGEVEESNWRHDGKRMKLCEFIQLGLGSALGAAFSSLARFTRNTPRAWSQAGQAKLNDTLAVSRIALLVCMNLLCHEGSAGRALQLHPVDWPPDLIEGHAELILTCLLSPRPSGPGIISLAPYANSPVTAQALRQAGMKLDLLVSEDQGDGLARVAHILLHGLNWLQKDAEAFEVLEKLCVNSTDLSVHFIAEGSLEAILTYVCLWSPHLSPSERHSASSRGIGGPEKLISSAIRALAWMRTLLTKLDLAFHTNRYGGQHHHTDSNNSKNHTHRHENASEVSNQGQPDKVTMTATAKVMTVIDSGRGQETLMPLSALEGNVELSAAAADCIRLLDIIGAMHR